MNVLLNIVKCGTQQVDNDFPYAARQQFSIIHYKQVINDGESLSLMYSKESI